MAKLRALVNRNRIASADGAHSLEFHVSTPTIRSEENNGVPRAPRPPCRATPQAFPEPLRPSPRGFLSAGARSRQPEQYPFKPVTFIVFK